MLLEVEPARHEFRDVCVFPALVSSVLSSLADCGFKIRVRGHHMREPVYGVVQPSKMIKGTKIVPRK